MDNNALKTISKTDDELRVANYIALYGGRDLEGEYFTTETEFDSSYTKTGRLYVDWEHGFGPALDDEGPDKDEVLGYVDWQTMKSDGRGLWVERVLDRRNNYMQYLETLIDNGLIGNSSEAVVGKVKKTEDGQITRWPLRRDTLTVQPMEPRMLTENVIGALKALNLEAPQQANGEAEAIDDSHTSISIPNATIIIQEAKTMTEEVKQDVQEEKPAVEEKEIIHETPINNDGLKTVSAKVDALTEQLNSLMQHMEDTPKIRNSGYFTQDGGKADQGVKSFGDFLKAVQRGDHTRLVTVYGSRKQFDGDDGEYKAAMAEQSGVTGGYLVPAEYLPGLLQVSMENAVVRPRASTQPVTSNSGFWPALDQYTAPTAGVGQSAFAGGVRAYWTSEAGALTETEPTFKQIEFNIRKMGGYSLVSNELIADSGQAIESLLTMQFGRAIAAMEDYAFLRGDGVGKPLGVLNWGGLVNQTPASDNAFGKTDALNMLAKFLPISQGNGVWAMHRSVIPDFNSFTSQTSDLVQYRESMPASLLGYNIVYSEHLPQANNSGNVILADFAAYIIFDRADVAVAFSPHFKFTNDQGTWRFTKRLDGQPWMTSSVTLADPQGSYTVSPFVNHND